VNDRISDREKSLTDPSVEPEGQRNPRMSGERVLERLDDGLRALDATSRELLETADRLEEARRGGSLHVVGWILMLLVAPVLFLLLVSFAPDEWRIKAVAQMMGTSDAWEAGSLILSKTSSGAYDNLMVGSRLVAENLHDLGECIDRARVLGSSVSCTLQVSPELGR
jgi:hypothetical protein